MVELDANDRWSTPPRIHRLWAGVLLPPFAWALHLTIAYALATLACSPPSTLLLYLVSAAALAAALTGGWIANQLWREAPGFSEEASGSEARGRFMAVGGVLLSGLFAAAIIAQTIPLLFLEPCRL